MRTPETSRKRKLTAGSPTGKARIFKKGSRGDSRVFKTAQTLGAVVRYARRAFDHVPDPIVKH